MASPPNVEFCSTMSTFLPAAAGSMDASMPEMPAPTMSTSTSWLKFTSASPMAMAAAAAGASLEAPSEEQPRLTPPAIAAKAPAVPRAQN